MTRTTTHATAATRAPSTRSSERKLIPRRPAAIDLTAMVTAAGADTVDKVVDHFIHRFLRVPLAEKDRAVLVDFLRGKLGSRRRSAGRRHSKARCESCCIWC